MSAIVDLRVVSEGDTGRNLDYALYAYCTVGHSRDSLHPENQRYDYQAAMGSFGKGGLWESLLIKRVKPRVPCDADCVVERLRTSSHHLCSI